MVDGVTTGYRVGLVGAGAIAFGCAAVLAQRGHRPVLWSPGGRGAGALAAGAPLIAEGALEAESPVRVATDAAQLADRTDVILIALPAFGHKSVMDAIAPHIRPGQSVIISSHASLGALHLGNLLAARGMSSPIIAWSTTVVTAKQTDAARVRIGLLRARVDMCTMPQSDSDAGLALCRDLFGDRFLDCGDLLAIALSNLNPQNHLGIALCNLTRMEKGESWSQVGNMTPMVSRLLEALDRERLDIAEALGLKVRTVHEHFNLSYHVPIQPSLSDMFEEMRQRGLGGNGPASAESRYVTEDVPYGLVPTVLLGDLAGRPATLHRAGLDMFCAMYGRDFRAENTLLTALDIAGFSLKDLKAATLRGTTRSPGSGACATG